VVADIGGTNTRIALFDPACSMFRALSSYVNRDHGRLEDIFDQWLVTLAEPAPDRCCMAVAAPPSGDRVDMINIDWSFSCSALANRFGFSQWRRINDFQANAYALPHLTETERVSLHAGQTGQEGRLATLGPGTGLGGAILDRDGDTTLSHACEPGHMGLSPGTALEVELFRLLLTRHNNVHTELLVSGPGLRRLYLALGELNDEPTGEWTPADISRRAVAGQDPLCTLALDSFCALLGSACGDFLLANGAYGGLYLAGGIIPRMIPYLGTSSFHQRLVSKGAMAEHLQQVPVFAITARHPGLIGAAHAAL
jgi:glucokinase